MVVEFEVPTHLDEVSGQAIPSYAPLKAGAYLKS